MATPTKPDTFDFEYTILPQSWDPETEPINPATCILTEICKINNNNVYKKRPDLYGSKAVLDKIYYISLVGKFFYPLRFLSISVCAGYWR